MNIKLSVAYIKGDCSAPKKSFVQGTITADLALETELICTKVKCTCARVVKELRLRSQVAKAELGKLAEYI